MASKTSTSLTGALIERTRPDPAGDVWLTDAGRRGEGRLVVRVLPRGTRVFYFRSTNASGNREFVRIGDYVRTGGDGTLQFTLTQARAQVDQLRARHRADRNVKHQLSAERRHREMMSGRSPAEQTLASLLAAYVSKLEARKARSAKEVAAAFKPDTYIPTWMLETRASAITRDHLVTVLRPLTAAGKLRQAAKLRSFLRAAFGQAMKSAGDPLSAGVDFGLAADPSANISQIEGHTKPGDRTLNETELAAWVLAVENMDPGPIRDALLISIWLGGQRPTQILRIRVTDVDLYLKAVTLSDPKGRRKTPRRWTLPLTKYPFGLIKSAIARAGDSPWAFANSRGIATVSTSLNVAVRPVIKKLVDEKKVRSVFRLGDIRRSVETQLQALGVPRDVRAYLASHGMGGVQAAHYERHEYQEEVRSALQKLSNWIGKVSLG